MMIVCYITHVLISEYCARETLSHWYLFFVILMSTVCVLLLSNN